MRPFPSIKATFHFRLLPPLSSSCRSSEQEASSESHDTGHKETAGRDGARLSRGACEHDEAVARARVVRPDDGGRRIGQRRGRVVHDGRRMVGRVRALARRRGRHGEVGRERDAILGGARCRVETLWSCQWVDG